VANLEEVSGYPLDEAQLEELFAVQRLCTVCWSTSDGWPVGVTHRYLWHDHKIWVTTTSQRHRVNALRKRPKSCVVINGEGTDFGPDRTVTLKTTCRVLEDRATLEWFFDAFAEAMHPGNQDAKAGFIGMMDTPRRVVLELSPVKTISYDGGKLAEAIVREGVG
jgi:general stress protein 26